MFALKTNKKGECEFILNDYIKYYTKEFAKLFKIMLIGFFIITAVILIKYKPIYKVSISGQKVGYSNSKNDIYTYIDTLLDDNDEKVAFVVLDEKPEFKIQLADRNFKTTDEDIKNEISSRIEIQYTSYAITYDKNNMTYVANKDEAEQLIDELKKNYDSKYTDKLGILQVYSDNYNDIQAVNKYEANTSLAKIISEDKKKSTTTVKVASNKKTNTTVKKSSSANGIKLSVKPISGTITSRYGGRRSPGGIGSTNHKGLDISAKQGTSIKACASGTVTFAGNKGSLGNLVIISHGNGVETYYGHCSKLYVSKGDKISGGDIIAAVGKTGAATGPHLHLEVHVNGKAVNPQRYVY